MPETLDEIGLRHKTDKSSMTHHYLKNYEKIFESWKDKEFVLLELGIAGGASIRTWVDYFPHARVYGIDNNPDCKMDGAFIGDATDESFLASVLSVIGMPDVVIDDSGHVGSETIKSFKFLFPLLNSSGLYFIEDSSVFYNQHYSGKFQSNGRSEVYNFFADMPYHVDVAGRGMCGHQDFAINHPTTDPPVPEYSRILESIHIHTGLWLFKRK